MIEYPVVITPLSEEDGGGYLGFAPDLPGCMSDGATPEEALNNLFDAITEWLDVQVGREIEIPQPGDASQRAREREEKLIDAIHSLADANDSAGEKILSLERKLSELIDVLKDDRGNPKIGVSVPRNIASPKTGRVH